MNISKLLDVTGNLNAAITRRLEKFSKMEDYAEEIAYVMKMSEPLNVFKGIKFSDRFWYVYKNMSLSHCKVCGKPYIIINHAPEYNPRFSLCRHKQNTDNYIGANAKSNKDRKKQFVNLVNQNKELFLSEEKFSEKLQWCMERKANYAFMISKLNMSFFHDLVLKTENMIPFDINDYDFPQRIYILAHNITVFPTCKFCNGPVKFIDRLKGYKDHCKKCEGKAFSESTAKSNRKAILERFNYDKYELLEIPDIMYTSPIVIKCKKCNHISKVYLINGALKHLKTFPLCEKCEHTFHYKEHEVYDFCEKYEHNIQNNTRKIIFPLELDVYLPLRSLAIEFNGIYWHSMNGDDDIKGKTRHLKKTNLCEQKGIHLVHIFENEWIYQTDIVKSMLRHLLGSYDQKIYARKCQIKEIDPKTSKIFLNENNLQGAVNSSVNIGLYFNGELVSLMSFSKSRLNKKYDWELVRFCNKLNYHVPGAASKLLTYFERTYEPKSIISYADRRWTMNNGNTIYDKLGFRLDHIGRPVYWYISKERVEFESRLKYQKHKLSQILEHFDPSKTEVQNMLDNGYEQVFDCGNLVYVKTY